MLRSYLKVAWRNLRRHKLDATINILGLALAISCCVISGLFVHQEWTYDEFHDEAERIFRVNRVPPSSDGKKTIQASTPMPLGPVLGSRFPEVETYVRMHKQSAAVVPKEKRFQAEALFADSTFFDVFSFQLQEGRPEKVLGRPGGIVLSVPAAQKYFGSTDPVGKQLTVRVEDRRQRVEVTGVVEAPPSRSSLQFDVVLSLGLYPDFLSDAAREMVRGWDHSAVSTFAVLNQSNDRASLSRKLGSFATQYTGEEGNISGTSREGISRDAESESMRLMLQPFTSVHLQPEISPEVLTAPSDPVYSYLMAGATLLVLLIAGINFTALALGRSAGRAREIGVRKTLGADRQQVRRQFWGEALLTSGAALVLGVGVAVLLLPAFNEVMGTELQFVMTPTIGLGLLGIALLVGILAGSYPGVVLSRLQVASVFRGGVQIGGRKRIVRGLVVVQFALSVGLVTVGLVMSNQLEFMQEEIGLQDENIVRLSLFGKSGSIGVYESESIKQNQDYQTFRQEAVQHASIEKVASAATPFFEGKLDTRISLAEENMDQVEGKVLVVDSTFRKTLGIEVIDGKPMDAPGATDETGVLVNESFVRNVRWRSPVGKTFQFSPSSTVGKIIGSATVKGVVENFHTQSMRQLVQPMVLLPKEKTLFKQITGFIYVQINEGQTSAALDALRQVWETVVPAGQSFQYSFLDEKVAEVYQTERRQRYLVQAAAGFSLLIACFGLFGLAALAVAQRRKEIGIRKALGASATSVAQLFVRDFLKLIGVGFVLAVPGAYWGAHKWLQNFARRVNLGLDTFLLSGLIVGGVALITVTVQAFRVARVDPAATLRYE